jgi:MHS family alpha-ketoglutarate permease-like MFS transporter
MTNKHTYIPHDKGEHMRSATTQPASTAGNSNSERISGKRLHAIIVGSAGNLVEWFDFYCYSAFALYFANAFFPAQDTTAQLMSTAGIFALGFFIRPIGGILFGHIGDRMGRKTALMASVLLMCFGSLLIACAPTYASAGILSPCILLLARLLQGLSLGGEYGASATYLSEMADSKHRGFYSSFQYVTLIGGQLLALLLLLVLQKFLLNAEELRAWGWRIPFFAGAALALLALRMRHNLPETQSFETARKQPKAMGGLKQLAQHPREVLLVVGLTMGGTLAFYVYTTYMQKFLRLSVGLTDMQTTAVSAASLLFAMCLQPIYGALSDRIGRKPLLIGFALLGTLFTVPLLTAIRHASGPWEAFGLIACAWIIVSGYTSINALVKAELFPASIRATGVGVPYAFAVSVFGGTAEYLALWFKSIQLESGFYWYTTGVIACTLLVCWFMRDTGAQSRINAETQG